MTAGFVLEVVDTNPLLNKLDVYAGLGVPEVWVFKSGAFTIHVLDVATHAYAVADASVHFPHIDLGLIARLAVRDDLPRALRELEAALR